MFLLILCIYLKKRRFGEISLFYNQEKWIFKNTRKKRSTEDKLASPLLQTNYVKIASIILEQFLEQAAAGWHFRVVGWLRAFSLIKWNLKF